MDLGSVIVLAIIVIGLFLKGDAILIISTSLVGFGALALLPSGLTFGATITASAVSFLIFIAQSYGKYNGNPISNAIFSLQKFGFLTAYIFWCWICTIIMPWIFSGEIYIYPVRAMTDYIPVPVDYSSTNVTQLAYLTLTYLVTISIYTRFDSAQLRVSFTKSMLALSLVMIGTGLIDLSGGKFLLEVFKNATYALAEDTTIGSTHRVIGAMPEASTYGGITASVFSILLILRNMFTKGPVWLMCLIGTFGMAILSTSSTAYGILIAAGCVFLLQSAIRATLDGRFERERSIVEMLFLVLGVISIMEIIFYFDDLKRVAFELLDSLIFNKTSTGSYEERTRWSRAALDAFFDSYGLGIGVGVARTSNGLINILCSTGITGASLLMSFLVSAYYNKFKCRRYCDTYSPFLALIPPLFGFALAGTTPDYGVLVAMLFALQRMTQDTFELSNNAVR